MVLQDLSPRRRELAALSLRMDEIREEIANLEGEMDRLSAGARSPGAPPSYGLRIGLIAEGLATKRTRLGDLTRRARTIESDIVAHPSGVYPSLVPPSDAAAIPSPQASTLPAPNLPAAQPLAAVPPFPQAPEPDADPVEATPVYPVPIAEPQTGAPAPIVAAKGVPTPEAAIPVSMPLPVGARPRARPGFAWGFVVATAIVLSLLIAGLLTDARRASPLPQPGSSGAVPALLGGQSTVTLVLRSTH